MRLRLHVAGLLFGAALALALAGCDDDPPSGPGPGPDSAAALPVLGKGEVLDRYTAEVWVHGGYAYTTTWGYRAGEVGDALKVWDVTDDTPRLVNTLVVSGASTLGDVQVSDDGRLLVVATEYSPGSIVIFDLADPAAPAQLARFSSASTEPGVHTAEVARVGGTLYAFLSVDPGLSPAQLVVVDVSDPANPVEVLARAMGNPFVHDVFVRDGLLFTALWNDGLTIWDVGGGGRGGSPANPVALGNVRTVDGSVHNVWWLHDPATGSRRFAFVGEEGPSSIGARSEGDIHVVDVSDLTSPHEVAFFTLPGAGTHNFWVDEADGVLYAAYYNAGVQALDVRGDLATCPDSARVRDRCDLLRAGRRLAEGLRDVGPVWVWGVHGDGTRVYASDMLNGLWKLGEARVDRGR